MPAPITTMHSSTTNDNKDNSTHSRPLSQSYTHAHAHPQPQPQQPLSTASLTPPVAALAGKKHPSTPPPPPLPLRSSRRPNSVIAHGIRLFDNNDQADNSSTAVSLSLLMHGATNNQQQQQHSKDNEKTQTHSTTHQRQGHIPHSKSQVLDDIDREASNVCEFMEDQLYFMWTPINPISTRRTTYLTIDNYLQYTAFFSDFGPFDIADVFRFCCLMKERHELAKSQRKVLCLHTKPDDTKRANAAFALCCYMMLLHDMTPEEAYAPVEYIHPAVASFRDAGCGPVTYTLSILDCLRGLRKGLDRGLLRLDKFNVKEYEHYERVSNGDFNWITPFFIAFAGPKDKMKREALLKHEAAREAAGTNTPSDEGSDETDTSSRYSFSSGRSSQSSVESSRSSTPSSTQSSVGSQLSTRTSSSSQSWRSSSSSGSQSASQMECPLSISMETSSIDSNSTITTTPPQQQQQEEQKRPNAEDSGAEIAQMTKVKKQRTRLNKSFRSVLSYFSTHNVQCIIRLNDKTYDKAHFTARGIEHVDMIYPDGTCPPWYIVERFFEVCERVAMDQGGVVAVHCMAGLGRTGTLIGAYLMRHFDMTARETIAFLRLMRPGSVVGPQQNWLAENEWRIRRREYQQRQPLQPQQQDERQKEIQDRLLMVQQSHGLTPESTKSSTTVSPAGSTIHTPGANYEQVFSRANSEGLESTWSEVADEVEGGSLTVLDDDDDEDGEDEAETSGFEDMSTTEDEIMEGNMGEDSDEDESDHGFDLDDTRHWSRPLSVQRSSPLRAQHTRQVSIGSLESLTPAFERDSVTDNGPDEDVLMGEAPDVEEPIMLKEHIGDTDYVIPGQPRKQDLSTLHYHHHHHHQNSRQPSSSSGGSRVHSDSHHQHKQHEEQQGDGNRNHHDDSSSGGEGKLYGKESFLRFSSESSSPSVMTSTLIEESTRSLSGLTGSSSNGQGQGTEGEVALAHVLETGATTGRQEDELLSPTTTTEATTPITTRTRTGDAQGTLHRDRAPCHSSAVVDDDEAPGPPGFESESSVSRSQPSLDLPLALAHALPIGGTGTGTRSTDNDKGKADVVEGRNSHRHHARLSAYHEYGQEHDQGEKERGQEDRHNVIAHPNASTRSLATGAATDRPVHQQRNERLKFLPGVGVKHANHHQQQQTPDSPPSFNGAGSGGSEEEGGAAGGGESELG